MKNKYFLILIMTILSSALFAQTTTWSPEANASTTGLWTEAANWTGGVVPDGPDFKAVLKVDTARLL